MIVARHEVPGKRPPPKEPSRRVRHERVLLIPEISSSSKARSVLTSPQSPNQCAYTCKNQTVPYGTAPLRRRFPGTSCQATIALSLRDKSHSLMEASRS
jgi:hypothetical protein